MVGKNLVLICHLLLSALTHQAWAHPPSANPDEVWESINQGWSGIYHQLISEHLDPSSNYVVWSMIAPKTPLDLRKPDSFRSLLNQTTAKKRSISHNLVAWKCKLPNGEHLMGATGMSGEGSGQSEKMVKAGYGLTMFYATFNDGWLSSSDFTSDIWKERGQNEEIYNVVVQVSSEDCLKMTNFLKKFVYHPSKPFTKFGLTVDPEKFEGGGCISLSSALLKKAGILKAMLEKTERRLFASLTLFGGNDLPLPERTKVPRVTWREGAPKKVGLNMFFGTNWNGGQKGVYLNLLDPELMIWGIKNLSSQLVQHPRRVKKAQERDGGGCSDRSQKKCRFHSVPIDNRFDHQAAKVASLAKAWKSQMMKQGYKMTLENLEGHPFLIFEK